MPIGAYHSNRISSTERERERGCSSIDSERRYADQPAFEITSRRNQLRMVTVTESVWSENLKSFRMVESQFIIRLPDDNWPFPSPGCGEQWGLERQIPIYYLSTLVTRVTVHFDYRSSRSSDLARQRKMSSSVVASRRDSRRARAMPVQDCTAHALHLSSDPPGSRDRTTPAIHPVTHTRRGGTLIKLVN